MRFMIGGKWAGSSNQRSRDGRTDNGVEIYSNKQARVSRVLNAKFRLYSYSNVAMLVAEDSLSFWPLPYY